MLMRSRQLHEGVSTAARASGGSMGDGSLAGIVLPFSARIIRPSRRARSLRRPAAPSRRCEGVDMGRATFLKLIGCWGIGLVLVLAIAMAIRLLG